MISEKLPLTSEWVAKILTNAGYNQREAANKLGVSEATISRWMNGETTNIKPEHSAKLRALKPRPGYQAKWDEFLEEVDAFLASGPVPARKALAEAIAKNLAPMLKVDVGELAELLMKMFDAKGIALDMTGQLLPDLHMLVEELAQKFAATVDGHEDAVQKALDACADRVALLLKQNTSGVTDAVVDKGQPRLDSLADQLQANADVLGNEVKEIGAKADELGNRADAHDGQSARRHRVEIGTMLVGFTAVAAVMVACTAYLAGRPVPGDRLTRGGGMASEAAKGGLRDAYASRESGIAGNAGSRKVGRPMPHHPLPNQAVAPCQGSERMLFGSCWLLTGDPIPCPLDQYQEGDRCYAPVADNSQKPTSEKPDRTGRETPTREQPGAGMIPGKEP